MSLKVDQCLETIIIIIHHQRERVQSVLILPRDPPTQDASSETFITSRPTSPSLRCYEDRETSGDWCAQAAAASVFSAGGKGRHKQHTFLLISFCLSFFFLSLLFSF